MMFLGEFLGVWAWGLFFLWDGGRDEWTVCQRGAGWLQGLSFLVV